MNTLANTSKRKVMDSSVRNGLIAAAILLLIVAIIWRAIISSNSLSSRIAKELAEYGLSVSPEALYQQSYQKNTSIAEMMGDVNIAPAVTASLQAGLPSDINKEGEIYLLLADCGDGEHVITVFVVDERVELAFIQVLNSDEVVPINS